MYTSISTQYLMYITIGHVGIKHFQGKREYYLVKSQIYVKDTKLLSHKVEK